MFIGIMDIHMQRCSMNIRWQCGILRVVGMPRTRSAM